MKPMTEATTQNGVKPITCDLLRLLFPGFFDEKALHSSEIKVETAALLDSVLGALEDEIRKALEYRPPEGLAKKDIHDEAHKLTVQFLNKLPDLREILQTDMQAAFEGDPAAASKDDPLHHLHSSPPEHPSRKSHALSKDENAYN